MKTLPHTRPRKDRAVLPNTSCARADPLATYVFL